MKNYREVADSVFQRSDEIIADNRRRKKNIVKACSVITCFCLVAVFSFSSGYFLSKPAGEEILPEGIGGFGGNFGYYSAYDERITGISGSLIDYIKENIDPNFSDWLDEYDQENKRLGYNSDSPDRKASLVLVIETFNVPKEYFEELNEWYIQINKENGWEDLRDTFTQEEIDVLFSRDDALITKYFASDYAIICGDRACAPIFYLNASKLELIKYGITEDEIKEKVELMFHDNIVFIDIASGKVLPAW